MGLANFYPVTFIFANRLLDKVAVMALSQGCPEGQSHSRLLMNVQHAKKKSKPFALMVTDYTQLQDVTGPPKFWQETVGKKILAANMCATSHEKHKR